MVEMSKSKMFLGGEWVTPSTGDYFESHNPYTGKPWLMVGRGGEEDANRAVEAAKKAFLSFLLYFALFFCRFFGAIVKFPV